MIVICTTTVWRTLICSEVNVRFVVDVLDIEMEVFLMVSLLPIASTSTEDICCRNCCTIRTTLVVVLRPLMSDLFALDEDEEFVISLIFLLTLSIFSKD